MKRRDFLATGLSLPFTVCGMTALSENPELSSSIFANTADNHLFLQDMQQRCYRYFIEAAHPATGLVADRAAADGHQVAAYSSSAACGFGLAAHCVAAENKWLPRGEIVERVQLLLRTLLEKADHERGFVYHFLNTHDAKRTWNCEASSIDTALMIAGAICASSAFPEEREIVRMADALYRRVDWQWMLGTNDCLHMGWTPEAGMIPHQWDSFSELLILVLLAMGAPENAIGANCWHAWRRGPVMKFGDEEFLSYPPLFVHQYPMAFFDFRSVRSSSGRSYWDNAVCAHRAHIGFLTELGIRFPDRFAHYGPDFWGITSSDSKSGYRDWGGPYETGRFEPDRGINGTLVPSAAAGGLPLVPDQASHTLRHQRAEFGDAIYGRYGFVNAYNPKTGWIGSDVIGIDTGISLLMAENLLSGNVWKTFMRHPAPIRALKIAGFTQQRPLA